MFDYGGRSSSWLLLLCCLQIAKMSGDTQHEMDLAHFLPPLSAFGDQTGWPVQTIMEHKIIDSLDSESIF